MFDQPTGRDSRWISVAFLHGSEAEKVLGIIDRSGAIAAREYLRQRDHGQETTDAALKDGYVYDRIPAGSTDHTVEDDASPYALTYSAQFRYVSFLRRYPVASEWEPLPDAPVLPSIPRRHPDDVWVPAQNRANSITQRSVMR